MSPVCAAEVEPPLSGVRWSVSLTCSATRAQGLRLHGDMRCLAGTAVAAGRLRMMTSCTFLFEGQSGFINKEFCIFSGFSFSQDDFYVLLVPSFCPSSYCGGVPTPGPDFNCQLSF